jgi:hypothetical protein
MAGEKPTLHLKYTLGQEAFNEGAHLWLLADVRQVSDSFQSTDPNRSGYVNAHSSGGQTLQVICPGETLPGQLVRTLDLLPIIPEFIFVIEILVEGQPMMSGDSIYCQIGADEGWTVPRHSIENFHFWAIPDPEGVWQFVQIDQTYHSFKPKYENIILPQPLHTSISIMPLSSSRLDVVIPSSLSDEGIFTIRIRSFDMFENPTHHEAIVLDKSREASQQIEVENHAIIIPQSYPSANLRVNVKELKTGLNDVSNPAHTEPDSTAQQIYWGILHGMFFNQRPLEYYYEYARDVAALDFCAGQHFSYEAALPGVWATNRDVVLRNYESEKFVPFLSVECDPGPCGHKIILFRDPDVPPLLAEQRSAVWSGNYPKRQLNPDTILCKNIDELWKELHALGKERAMVTAHHTADWHYHDPILQRLAEIYSKWGTCEYRGNPLDHRPAYPPREYVQDALALNYRLGIIAGGDTHDSRPGNRAPEPFGVEFPDGLTAVHATSLTHEGIWEALWQRRTYGTTGTRILLWFQVNDVPMGGNISLCDSREIKVKAIGTAPIQTIEVLLNNQVIYRWLGEDEQVSLIYIDDTPIINRNYYYTRLTQFDGHMAWSSPVWIWNTDSRGLI